MFLIARQEPVSIQKCSFGEIINKLPDASHFVIINRKGVNRKECNLEIGLCVGSSIVHFLFLYIAESYVDYFVKKYNFELMK